MDPEGTQIHVALLSTGHVPGSVPSALSTSFNPFLYPRSRCCGLSFPGYKSSDTMLQLVSKVRTKQGAKCQGWKDTSARILCSSQIGLLDVAQIIKTTANIYGSRPWELQPAHQRCGRKCRNLAASGSRLTFRATEWRWGGLTHSLAKSHCQLGFGPRRTQSSQLTAHSQHSRPQLP